MFLPTPFFRAAGSGPGVVCLHSNASQSGQWRELMHTLAPTFHVLAADAYGAGKSAAWQSDRAVTLRDEVAFLEPVFARAGDPFVLVGHSYGAAVALIAAISQPHRVRALALYEPTLFGLLDAKAPAPDEVDGIRRVFARVAAAADAGDANGAGERFIDYWSGEGAWDRIPDARKTPMADSVLNIRAWVNALFNEPTPLAAFSRLDIPVLYMMGKDSPAPSRSVGRLLTQVLPQVELVEFEGVGHMGPITDAEQINESIVRFLERRVAEDDESVSVLSDV
ncbi:MAG TPA: alpha/beta hydrolase [Burkholderiaceae bacterium]|nr:alpha/beta hydrolase [Burkholderiaceae bacterium]